MFKFNLPFIALLSDVHSNLEALTAVLADIASIGIDHIGFLGDAVGYGPDPLACLNLLRDRCEFILGGNHDRAAAVGEGIDEMSNEAMQTALWTSQKLSDEDKRYLENLPLVERFGDVLFTHGSPLSPEKFDYILTVSQAKKVFLETPSKILFIGHSHIPTAFIELEFKRMFAGHVHRVVEKPVARLTIEPAKRYVINIGSVGQPRDGNSRAAYGILDIENSRFELRRVSYNTGAVVEKIKRADFGESLAERLTRGV
jgi:diadenosine tetraphosphatase ApaH/serine/threonine PP2A family protein phosphatase